MSKKFHDDFEDDYFYDHEHDIYDLLENDLDEDDEDEIYVRETLTIEEDISDDESDNEDELEVNEDNFDDYF